MAHVLAKDLRDAVLQAAIQGLLTNYENTDTSILTILEDIKNKKNELIKNKEIKKVNIKQTVDFKKIMFDIPNYWQWVSLEEITSVLGDGLHGTPKYSTDGSIYFINGNNLCDGHIIINASTKKVDDEEANKYRKKLSDRTIFLSINGTLGNIAFYNNEPIILGKSACYFNVFEPINLKYMSLFFRSKYFLDYINSANLQSCG